MGPERQREAENRAATRKKSVPRLPLLPTWFGFSLGAIFLGGLAMIFGKRRAAEQPGVEALGYLRTHLGPEATAYLSGAEPSASISRPSGVAESRLLAAYEAARQIVDAYGDETAVAWFFGMNPALEDRAPAFILRNGIGPEQWSSVIPAALEFVETAR